MRRNRIQLNSLADAVTELRYRRWLREEHNLDFTPPADSTSDALHTHLKAVKQFLSKDVVNGLDYRVESAVYPTEFEAESLAKDIRQTARDITLIAHASSNRRVKSGGIPLPVLFKLAPLAGRKLKFQKGNDTLKIGYNAPTFEGLGIHHALKRSATRQHKLQVALEYIRHRCGLAPLPTPLRTNDAHFIHNFRPHFDMRGQPSLAIPKVKRGTLRLWFQPREEPQDNTKLGKNVFQLYSSKADANLRPLVKKRETVKIKWYHKEESITDRPSHYRRYASRKAWEDAHATEANLEPLKPGILNIIRSGRAEDSLDDTRLPRIIKQQMNPPSPLVRRAFIEDHFTNSPDARRVQEGEAGGRFAKRSESEVGKVATGRQRVLVRYHLSHSVRPSQSQSDIDALWEARSSLANTSAGQTRMYSTLRVSGGRPNIVSSWLIFPQAVLIMCMCRVRIKMNIIYQFP